MNSKQPIRVLFVCAGNICRSPMAEAIFRAKVQEKGLADQFIIDSAGTGSWHVGELPHKGTQAILKSHNIAFDGIRARQIQVADARNFDWILVMDQDNWDDVKALMPEAENVHKVLEFSSTTERNVPDPFYTGGFEHVYSLLDEALDNFLQVAVDRARQN
ncbi:protein-tyrosine phosphatase [Sulfobacillus thermosulfidooxidans DSM 9293]|uniref:protein-tyrosine-phosphatase n=1 Tax=Sulfobacillus thermosulfidooxidans (strain DSM 9293 / VKM B-1269 / AT-1) TaxID=929705 RepID=A0A1W1WKH5_SULTA|nr:low molecular weight protein-tyrosine-phosphatase [Sulfobacillus thermosulfidooxidans]SMC06811.1 protein-tyrosine phosphatase [Sulfobacillus thermosulfidooxidans DSM 9293]